MKTMHNINNLIKPSLFVVKTDRFMLMFPHRVGSRSITGYFYGSDKVHSMTADTWVSVDNLYAMLEEEKDLLKILVLREPRDRLMAGRQVAKYTKKPKLMVDNGEDIMFDIHCAPWLVHLPMHLGYKYIPFEKLSDYVKEGEKGYYGRQDKDKWPARRWYKSWDNLYPNWDEELRRYDELTKNKGNILDPEEFKRLVATSNHINIKNHPTLRFKQMKLSYHNTTQYIDIEKI